MKDLSVIIVSYNTLQLTLDTLHAIEKSFAQSPDLSYELIVIDNASSDGSETKLKKYVVESPKGSYIFIGNSDNKGFGAANNQGIRAAKGKYVLLLNSDLIADTVDFSDLLAYMDAHQKVGVLTVRVNLQTGGIDPASHRGFPTPWRSLCYFLKLEKLTAKFPLFNRLFGGYHLTHLPLTSTHTIDSPTAAFYLTRKTILDAIHGFDETFFMYGEDLDMSYRIKELGFDIVYYPKYAVLHLKKQSGLNNKDKQKSSQTLFHFYDAMQLFYDKHYAATYPSFINALIHRAIAVKYYLARR